MKIFQLIHNLTGFSNIHNFSIILVMTSSVATWFSNLHILSNLPKAISLQSFNVVDCMDSVLQRDYKSTMMSFHISGI